MKVRMKVRIQVRKVIKGVNDMFYFTVEELIENVSNKENYEISLYNRENSIVTISDSDI